MQAVGLVEHAAGAALGVLKEAHGSEGRLPGQRRAEGEAVQRVAAHGPQPGGIRPDEGEARAADAQVAADVEEQVVQPQVLGQVGKRVLGIVLGEENVGELAEKIAGVDLGDVAWEGDAQQVVGTAPHGLALVDGLTAEVVVKEPFPLRADGPEEFRHRGAEGGFVQRGGASNVLIQEKATSLDGFAISVAGSVDGFAGRKSRNGAQRVKTRGLGGTFGELWKNRKK